MQSEDRGCCYGIEFRSTLLCLLAPVGFSLSLSTHPDLVSRGFVALAVAGFGWGLHEVEGREQNLGGAVWALTGLAVGMSLISRPIECAAIL